MKGYTLITGACGGLGGAFVRLLAARGEPLFLTGRSEERLSALAQALRAEFAGADVLTYACDLTDSAARSALFCRADEAGILFSRLVYVAGVDTQMAFASYSEEKLVLQLRACFEGAVSLARGVFLRRREGERAEFLVIGSMSAMIPMPYFALYSAAKKGLEQFFIALREEWRGQANVTVVSPGGIPTREDIVENIASHGWFGRMSALSPEEVARRSLRALAKNRRRLVPGFWNKVLSFCMHLVPLPLKMRVVRAIWSKTQKDAF